jgi:phosphomannomutase
MTIRFGTDGWRAVISETFTFGNLRLVAQAIADYILEEDQADPSVVIGFDTRFLSDRYGAEVARVMAANNIQTWLARADTPTPAVSYAVVNKKATAGVMITASHNAPRYNGIKMKAAYGGSASSTQNRRVEHHIERNLASVRGPNLMSLQRAISDGLIQKFDPSWAYYEHLSTLVDLDCISSAELRVVADGMFGAGRGVIGEVLARGRTRVQNIRHEMNPGFGGIHPEPIAKHLGMLMSTIQAGHWDVGLATDGDADRIGAVDDRGEFVDPHRIFALVLRYLLEKRGLRGRVVRTVSTTRMLDRLAARHDIPIVEKPVGFNYIADEMINNNVVMGGEESGGMSIKGHIPEGDGILMGLLLLEVIAEADRSLHELVVDLDGVKYYLEDGSWLLIRPSGTEPVLRVYAEAPDDERVKALLTFGEEMAAKA